MRSMLHVISVVCYLMRICVCTSYYCGLVVGLRARFCEKEKKEIERQERERRPRERRRETRERERVERKKERERRERESERDRVSCHIGPWILWLDGLHGAAYRAAPLFARKPEGQRFNGGGNQYSPDTLQRACLLPNERELQDARSAVPTRMDFCPGTAQEAV